MLSSIALILHFNSIALSIIGYGLRYDLGSASLEKTLSLYMMVLLGAICIKILIHH